MLPPLMVIAEELVGWGWVGKDRSQKTGCWPQIAEMHMKEVISVRTDVCIVPYIEEC